MKKNKLKQITEIVLPNGTAYITENIELVIANKVDVIIEERFEEKISELITEVTEQEINNLFII